MSDNTATESSALERILALQTTLNATINTEQWHGSVREVLCEIPGIAGGELRIVGQISSASFANGEPLQDQHTTPEAPRFQGEPLAAHPLADQEQLEILPVAVGDHTYGDILIEVYDVEQYLLYRPYLVNTANLLALHLENRRLADELQASNERVEDQIQLRTSELSDSNRSLQFAQYAIDHVGEAAFWARADGQFAYVNEAAGRTLGYTREEMLELTVADVDPLFPTDLWPKWWQDVKECGFQTIETTHRTRDGREFPVEVTVSHVDFGGEEYLCGFARDISKRKETEEALLEEKRFSEALIESIPGILYANDAQGRLFRWNRNMETVFGYSGQELDGADTRKLLVAEEDHPKAREAVRRMLSEGQAEVELNLKTKTGEVLPYLCTGGWFDHGGESYRVGIGFDISDRRRAEEALLREKRFTDALLESLPGIVFAYDEKRRLFRWNHHLEVVSGYSTQELEGRDVLTLVADEDRENASRHALKALTEGYAAPEVKLLTKDGRQIPFYCPAASMEHGDERFVIGAGLDLTGRKQAEDALRESEQRYALAQKAANIGSWEWDITTGQIRWSELVESLFGFAPGEFKGTYEAFLECVHPEDRETVTQAVDLAVREDTEYDIEHRIVWPDGTVHWLAETGEVVRDEQDTPISMFGIVRDITESRQAADMLRATVMATSGATGQDFFTSLVEHLAKAIGVPIALVSEVADPTQARARTIAVWAGDHLAENIEYSLGGTPCEEVFSQSTCCYPQAVQRLFPEDKLLVEMGAESYLGTPLHDRDGKPWGILAVLGTETLPEGLVTLATSLIELFATRVTAERERMRAEEELRRAQGLLQAAVEASPAGVLVADAPNVNISLANSAALGIRGQTQEALTDIPIEQHPSNWHTFYPDGTPYDPGDLPLSRAVMHGETVQNVEVLIERETGERRWVLANAAPVRDDQGNVVAGVVVFPDITERRQVEEDRERLVQTLETRNAELERFVYTVSHDLKTPLITINWHAGALKHDIAEKDNEAIEADAEGIIDASHIMLRLLNEVLELSRIGRVVGVPEDVPLDELISDVVGSMQGSLADRGVLLDVASDLPTLHADRTRLHEVFQNLLENAVKYLGDQPEPHIEVGTRKDGEETVCFVRDNGIGVDPRYQEKIFGLFEQLDKQVEGTGVGLTAVKRIIEFHGGRIWCESQGEGHGSTFCFVIPPETAAEA